MEPVRWPAEREQEFTERLVLYNTGLQRMAKNLLRQVVGSYLAREVATVQVLHGIKTLAMEMGFAMQDGEWKYLGSLLNRHWQLNQTLDPHTTNAPINHMLARVQPFVSGRETGRSGRRRLPDPAGTRSGSGGRVAARVRPRGAGDNRQAGFAGALGGS